jgi:hypothetical protein
MISEQWPRFVLPIVRRAWQLRKDSVVSPAAQFYGGGNSNSAAEYSQGIGELGTVPEYNSSSAEGAAASIQYDSFNPLYEKTFTHKRYAKGIAIDKDLYADARIGTIQGMASKLGYAFGKTIAMHQSSVFVNAFTTLGADGKALCANDHPRNTADATAIDNLGSTALSYAAIVATMQAGKKMTDDRGDPMPVMYDTIYVPTELEATAIEETKGLLKPGTADNTASALQTAGLRIVVDPYLTSATNWFMVDSQLAKDHLLWFWREQANIIMDPASDFNLVARYNGTMRYSFGFDDFRWIYGHNA